MPTAIRLFCWLLPALFLLPVAARNVDLATVPPRDSVQLTIYNSEDLTLVRETRKLTFKQGINPLQFSWSNTLIDPTSVQIEFADPAALELRDTTFPHDKPEQLYWNIYSDRDREAVVEISYFTSGISWSADYVVIADAAENQLALESFVRVDNRCGEDYENAQVRLVVGTINLVEQIAQLARLPVGRLDELERSRFEELRQRVAREAMPTVALEGTFVEQSRSSRPKEVQKEGLGEYFIYTIEGTETIPDGWSKRLRSFTADAVPLTVVYRYRPREYGDRLVRMYLLRNDLESKLGSTPLPDGTMRVYRAYDDGDLAYLAQQNIRYTPIGDTLELNLGADREVIFELIALRHFRDEIWLRQRGLEIYRRADDPGLRVNDSSTVAGWNEHTLYLQRIRNYTRKPIKLEIRRSYSGDIRFRSLLNTRLHDFQTVEFITEAAAGEHLELPFELIQRQGYNAKQNRIVLEQAAPATAQP